MNKKTKQAKSGLKAKAEEILKIRQPSIPEHADALKLIHELSVHQIELELQQEELVAAKETATAIAEKYTQLYDFAPSGYFTLSRDGKIIELNLSAARLLGRDRSLLIKSSLLYFIADGSKPVFRTFFNRVFENNIAQSCEVTLSNNKHLHITGIADNESCKLTAVDITSLKESRERNEHLLSELTEAKKRLELSLQNASIGGWEWNIKTGKIVIDEGVRKIFALHPDKSEINSRELLGILHPEDTERVQRELNDVINKSVPLETIFRIPGKDGNVKYFTLKANVSYNIEKDVRLLNGIIIDITRIYESSEKALLKLNEELSKSNNELQNFAYVASHDLQEPLRMVTSFVQLLEKQYGDKLDEKARLYINYAVDGAKRMYELLNSLLVYSRIRTKGNNFREVDMNEVVEKVIDNLRIVINETATIIQNKGLPVIFADKSQMIQLVQNLVDNSIKFSKSVPCITISSSVNNHYYIFSVKDKGIGIEPAYFERIFRIFQRLHTSRDYSGTGIGLAVCKSIVERHGGRIWVESAAGKGSTFFFSIPLENKGVL